MHARLAKDSGFVARFTREAYAASQLKCRSGFVKDMLNDWLGRRLRILVGAAVFALLSGIAYYGWRPSLIAIPGCLVSVFGPSLGIPDIGPFSAWMTSTAIAAMLILIVSGFLRS